MDRLIELLAPAGSYDMARAVISAGADAVYFAGKDFGARAYANNFTREEAADMIRLLHLHGKKAYLTVNTLLKNLEMEKQLFEYIKFYYETGVDAVLIQDFGVSELIAEYFPGLERHASTQMNIASAYGAGFLKQQGFGRIVAARELSISEIAAIHRECDIEIEAFVHGALCVCYSGQCLMSGFLGGRSGNRGRCAQPCRLPYEVFDQSFKKIKAPGAYILSPKDLCAIRDIPRLIEAGVCSLKIEGRMKQPDYAREVTSVYRRYLDLYMEYGSDGYRVKEEDVKRLMDSGNRGGFTNAYFDVRQTPDMMSFKDSSHKADPKPASSSGDLDKGIKLGLLGHFTAAEDEAVRLDISCRNTRVSVSGGICQRAKNQPASKEDIISRLKRTGDSPFFWQEITTDISDSVFIPLKEINELRRKGIAAIYDELTAAYCREDFKNKFVPIEYKGFDQDNKIKPGIIIRVTTMDQLVSAEAFKLTDRIIVPRSLWNEVSGGERYIYELPVVVRGDEAWEIGRFIEDHPGEYYEASSFDALGLLYSGGVGKDHIFGGHRLYALSNRTKYALSLAGGKVPIELSAPELAHRDNRGDVMLLYGRIPLMYTANCIRCDTGGCRGDHRRRAKDGDSFLYIKDRKGKLLPVRCDCIECQNVIYNALPLDIMDLVAKSPDTGVTGWEVSFTTEGSKEIKAVLERVKRAAGKASEKPPYEFTRGHYNKSIQ